MFLPNLGVKMSPSKTAFRAMCYWVVSNIHISMYHGADGATTRGLLQSHTEYATPVHRVLGLELDSRIDK